MRSSASLALLLLTAANAAPFVEPPSAAGTIHLPILTRHIVRDERYFARQALHINARALQYDPVPSNGTDEVLARRASAASVALTDIGSDTEYTALIGVGSPAKSFQVVLDTGSADLILADSAALASLGSSAPAYVPADSSSSTTTTTPFNIQYGSGSAAGVLVKDNVSLGGFSVTSQTLASCSTMSTIISGTISGLLGLGWQQIASSNATPLVQQLASSGTLPAQEFGFALSNTGASDGVSGGTLTLGGTNTSLYSGSINWVNLSNQGYWSIPLQAVTIGNQSLGISASKVIVDTGTSLIGMPSTAVAAIYASIPNSKAVSVDGRPGYHSYPCSTTVELSFQFGGFSYNLPSTAFNAGTLTSTECLGSVFELSGSSLSYIFGDAFLKGLYTAYRFSPSPAVGFASLASSTSPSAASDSSSAPPAQSSTPAQTKSSAADRMATPLIWLFAVALGVCVAV